MYIYLTIYMTIYSVLCVCTYIYLFIYIIYMLTHKLLCISVQTKISMYLLLCRSGHVLHMTWQRASPDWSFQYQSFGETFDNITSYNYFLITSKIRRGKKEVLISLHSTFSGSSFFMS